MIVGCIHSISWKNLKNEAHELQDIHAIVLDAITF